MEILFILDIIQTEDNFIYVQILLEYKAFQCKIDKILFIMDMSAILENSNLTDREKIVSNSSNMSITIEDLNHEKLMRKLPVLLYMAMLMIIGLPGNLSVLVVFVKHYKRSTYRKFVITLAIVDTVSCSVCMPFEMIEMSFLYTFHASEVCKLLKTLTTSVSISSGLIILGLSIDRYRHVCQPFKIQMSEKISTWICVSSITLALLLASPCYLISGIRQINLINNVTGSDCYIIAEEFKSTNYPFYYNVVMIIIFIVCTVSLIVMYILIGQTIYKQAQFRKRFHPAITGSNDSRKDINSESTSVSEGDSNEVKATERKNKNSRSNNQQSRQKFTKVAFGIFVLFIMSYLPYLIATTMTAKTMSVTSIILSIMSRSVFLNSVGNPIVYGVFDKRFRGFLKKYMCFCQPKYQVE